MQRFSARPSPADFACSLRMLGISCGSPPTTAPAVATTPDCLSRCRAASRADPRVCDHWSMPSGPSPTNRSRTESSTSSGGALVIASAARATQVRGSEGRHYRSRTKGGLWRSQLPHRPEAAEARVRRRRALASRPEGHSGVRPGRLAQRQAKQAPRPSIRAFQFGRHEAEMVVAESEQGSRPIRSRVPPATFSSPDQSPMGHGRVVIGSPPDRQDGLWRSAAAKLLASFGKGG